MNNAVAKLIDAQKYAMSIRPKTAGFPVIAEALRQAGVQMNRWSLPSCQSLYFTKEGPVVQQGSPIVIGTHSVPAFNQESLVAAIRADQAGHTTFDEFLKAAWKAGVISYDADFVSRKVTYYGANGESYLEEYPAVELNGSTTHKNL